MKTSKGRNEMGKIFTVRDMKRSVEEKKMREEAKAEREAEATALAKAEEAKILDTYPEIGILQRENWGFSRIACQRVYYVYSTHNRDYFENTDLLALVETIRSWSER
jgi:hypothetical protein